MLRCMIYIYHLKKKILIRQLQYYEFHLVHYNLECMNLIYNVS